MVSSSRQISSTDIFYQVDSSATASGKIIASTKRRACWTYGTAIDDQNKIGASLRGREHTVSFEWSLASGKKRVFHDSIEVHYSVGPLGDFVQDGKFQCTWSTRNNDKFTLIAYAYPPLSKNRSSRRQFDLIINDCSFSNLPRIYELGSWSCPNLNPVNVTPKTQKDLWLAKNCSKNSSPIRPLQNVRNRSASGGSKVEKDEQRESMFQRVICTSFF